MALRLFAELIKGTSSPLTSEPTSGLLFLYVVTVPVRYFPFVEYVFKISPDLMLFMA